MKGLTASERECIIGATDADQGWNIYTDAGCRFFRRLQALARAWGVEPRHVGSGVEFELPLQAVRFTKPRRTSERQRRAALAAILKARLALRNPVKIQAAEEVTVPARIARGSDP